LCLFLLTDERIKSLLETSCDFEQTARVSKHSRFLGIKILQLKTELGRICQEVTTLVSSPTEITNLFYSNRTLPMYFELSLLLPPRSLWLNTFPVYCIYKNPCFMFSCFYLHVLLLSLLKPTNFLLHQINHNFYFYYRKCGKYVFEDVFTTKIETLSDPISRHITNQCYY
jgi:hypothetical protein